MKNLFKEIWLIIYSIFYFNFYKSSKIFNNELLRSGNSKIDLLLNDNYVPQGICVVDESILVTMYDYNHELNSKVCVIKSGEIVHTTILDNNAHVGGICYDEENNNIWITDRSGTISCYDAKDVLVKDEAIAKYKKVKIPGLINISNYNAVGFITYFDNKLYMGNYNIHKKSKIVSYELNKDGKIDAASRCEYPSHAFVQGITFKKEGDHKLLFVSSSYGINSSLIQIIDCDTKKVLHKVKMPPMLEQITFNENGDLLALFESNAEVYKKYHFKTSDINLYRIDKIYKEGK